MTASTTDKRSFLTDALIDCGSTGSCIDTQFVRENGIITRTLPIEIPVFNADGTPNNNGPITEVVELFVKVQDHTERIELAVSNLDKSEIFLGYDWLEKHNPSIDWRKKEIKFDRCPLECTPLITGSPEEEEIMFESVEEGERILAINIQEEVNVRAFQTTSSKIAEQSHQAKKRQTFEEIVPSCYHLYRDVFSKEAFDELPPRRPWDHAIELIPGAEAVDSRIYPLNLEERKQLDAFLDENLTSGRIRPSKSPMAAPFFFVKKKDGTLRPVQDY